MTDLSNQSSGDLSLQTLSNKNNYVLSRINDSVPAYLGGWSSLQVVLTVVLVLVTYDQGTSYVSTKTTKPADMNIISYVHQTERLHRRSSIQSTIHGTLSSSNSSQV